ncbi:MAG: division/cell wall cluster transcriptional repressor MraZ [Microbacteriaceae bacterium]|nr:division/cell wall cluster transcriptional repressor MraZ [Microbacteriaceae bacterium]MDR9443359.1 division/cell wall cluster transcriptional repressor MraZ [Microbacteriaceae bacterium]
MLLGTHTPKLDDKGRVILPSRFRDEFASGLVVTRGQDRCLYVFSAGEFQEVHEKIKQAPMTSSSGRDYLRVFLSGASDEIPDKQGRVTIPAGLREYAGLDRELVMIGVGNRAEIWDSVTWNQYLENNEQSFSDISEEVIPGLF